MSGPRLGLDLAWYARNGFGSLHGVNTQDGAAVYSYLTHGWKNSGGLANGICPSGKTCSGGFFTAYTYELHSPPLYPPQYVGDANWLLAFIHAANADAGGQRAKIFVRLVPQLNFDPTLVGTLQDFLQRLGPASQNPSVVGFGFRGASPGIYEGGGTCCGGVEGPSYIPASIWYGPTGMNSFPQNVTQLQQMWSTLQSVANASGYPLGISTGLEPMERYLGSSAVWALPQWFMQGSGGYGASPLADPLGSQLTYNSWYDAVATPPIDSSISLGNVAGEWDQNWFVLNQGPYYMTQSKIQAMFHGFADGYAANPKAGQYMFIYGMPYLTNDDSTWVNKKGPCPYMSWFIQYATQYGFFTDYSPAPAPGSAGGGSTQTVARISTGIYIHLNGDTSIPIPSWTQTNPVHCCGTDTFTIDGQLISLKTGQGIGGAIVKIMGWDFTTCTWKLLTTVTTDSHGYWGYPNGGGFTDPPVVSPSPSLPNTGRNQAYFYPAYLGNSTYGPSNGLAEDLPIITVGTTPTTTSIITCARSTVVIGTATTCKARVQGYDTDPTGTVTWSSSSLGKFSSDTCTLSMDTCSVSYSPTSTGFPVRITASYAGDSQNPPSSGTYSLNVAKWASSTTISCNPTSVAAGSLKVITCKATVRGYWPAGRVTWSKSSGLGSIEFASTTCTLYMRVCSVTMKGAMAGTVVVKATYGGNPSNKVSSNTAKLTIVRASPTLSVSCTSMSVAVGHAVTCTATLKGHSGSVNGEGITWSKTAGAGGISFSSSTCALSLRGVCSIIVKGTRAGSVTIQAAYAGDRNNRGRLKAAILTVK